MLDQLSRMGRQLGKAADAKGQMPQRPRIRQVDDPDRHRSAIAARGSFGYDADTDTLLHHAADAVKSADADTKFEAVPRPRRMLPKMLLKRTPLAQSNKRLVEHLAEGDVPAARQLVSTRHRENQSVDAERERLQVAKVDDIGDDAGIDDAFRHRLHDLVAGPLLQIDVDIGMGHQERGERLGQELRHC